MIRTIIIINMLFSFSTFGDGDTKYLMRDVLKSYMELVPVLYGQGDKRTLKKKLGNLKQSFSKAEHVKMLKSENFSPSLNVIKNTLDDISENDSSDIRFVNYRAKTLVSTCISCHSQLPNSLYPKVNSSYSKVISENIKNEYDKARFAYMLRDYKGATDYFKKYFSSISKDSTKRVEQEKVLKKILQIYISSLNDFKGAKKYLFVLKNKSYLNDSIKRTIEVWYQSLVRVQNIKGIPLRRLIDQNLLPLEKEISSSFIHENDVLLFFIRRKLNSYIVKNARSKMSAEALYWLGLIENRSNSIGFEALGDQYLKGCIYIATDKKMAKKCYRAYEDSIIFSFTGSSGMLLPDDIKLELKKLKSLL